MRSLITTTRFSCSIVLPLLRELRGLGMQCDIAPDCRSNRGWMYQSESCTSIELKAFSTSISGPTESETLRRCTVRYRGIGYKGRFSRNNPRYVRSGQMGQYVSQLAAAKTRWDRLIQFSRSYRSSRNFTLGMDPG